MRSRKPEPHPVRSRGRGRRRGRMALILFGGGLLACGPFFPNRILTSSATLIAQAPVADFRVELARLRPVGTLDRAVMPERGKSVFDQSIDAACADFAAATRTWPAERRMQAEAAFRAFRVAMAELRRERSRATKYFVAPAVPPDLPPEFRDYATGLAAEAEARLPDARAAWTKLLARPPEERHYRTVWAAYQLGRSWMTDDPAKARAAFARTRAEVARGFPDPLGLAAATIGWEARLALDEGAYDTALRLYVRQHQSGDRTALMSLRFAVRALLRANDAEALRRIAADRQSARIVTAYLLAYAARGSGYGSPADYEREGRRRWLRAVAEADATLVGGDRLAWLAYQDNDMAAAETWLAHADAASPLTLWIRAKLALRAGAAEEALELLSRAARAFPPAERWGDAKWSARSDGGIVPVHEIHAERGVLLLGRGEYVAALRALLDSGRWWDAAYVAERVLTPAELRTFVETFAPPEDSAAAQLTADLRALLSRRLARDGDLEAAAVYAVPGVRFELERLTRALADGNDLTRPADERAEALWTAAVIMRGQGLDVVGTETSPDWAVVRGRYRLGDTAERRVAFLGTPVAHRGEFERVAAHGPPHRERWHYRYVALDLARRATDLMDDNTELLARRLIVAGRWVASEDPGAAEPFYHALVRRCGNLEIGREADRRRWFPPTPPR